jgi:hypothetical protein
MDEYLIVLAAACIVLPAVMAAMAVGVIFKRPCLKGSCGGVNACPGCPNKR